MHLARTDAVRQTAEAIERRSRGIRTTPRELTDTGRLYSARAPRLSFGEPRTARMRGGKPQRPSIAGNERVLKSDTGLVTVKVTQPFHVYAREPSNMSRVKESAFVGVTSVKQPDGTERATEIHVFPEELRGLGEGSRMMPPDTSATARRMTNGQISG